MILRFIGLSLAHPILFLSDTCFPSSRIPRIPGARTFPVHLAPDRCYHILSLKDYLITTQPLAQSGLSGAACALVFPRLTADTSPGRHPAKEKYLSTERLRAMA
jgi:hypothetical protein